MCLQTNTPPPPTSFIEGTINIHSAKMVDTRITMKAYFQWSHLRLNLVSAQVSEGGGVVIVVGRHQGKSGIGAFVH